MGIKGLSHAKARQRVAGVPPVVATAAQRRKGVGISAKILPNSHSSVSSAFSAVRSLIVQSLKIT